MDIPGYYFDPMQKRYFKIEGNHTAPTDSAWSADNVKKRKLEDQKAEEALQRLDLCKGRIKRAHALNDPLTGGFLAREHGIALDDMMPAILAADLVNKGGIPFKNSIWSSSQHITAMCIVGEDPWTDLGFGYISPDGSSIASTYIPRDRNGRVHRRLLADYSTPEGRISPYREFILDQISDIKFNRRRGVLLIAQTSPSDRVSLRAAVPAQLPEDEKRAKRPCWQLGQRPCMQSVAQVGPSVQPPQPLQPQMGRLPFSDQDHGYVEVNVVTPGPDTSEDILCAAGSNRGIVQWKGEQQISLSGSLKWIAPSKTDHLVADNAFKDIFAVEYRRNHESVILGGGRPGRCFIADTRVRDVDWKSFRHGSSIAQELTIDDIRTIKDTLFTYDKNEKLIVFLSPDIKSLNEHHVLISGTRHMMQTYDLRMIKGHTSIVSKWRGDISPEVKTDQCIKTFPAYSNDSYNKIGFDVDVEAGIVATAHDDGKVAIHSLESGHRLKSPAIDRIQADIQNKGPIKAMQFEKMSGDQHSSLFVALGSNLEVYSLGDMGLDNKA
ncbi:hypothetical protein SCAR479_03880 [Seiridium cardinale]|uniref:Uncharacterized protein n=1 Tax=Seiridium cardinale TaxID=138064 RepID=A0ABR2Y016_9PEZI